MRTSTRYVIWLFVGLLVIYMLLLDTLAKPLFEYQASEQYGAEVSIDSLELSPFVGKVTLHHMQVADRSQPMRNLAQAEHVYIDIDMQKLASNIIDVEELNAKGLMFFSQRETPATILRPLVDEDSDIATAAIPNFDMPDTDALMDRQREKLEAEVEHFEQVFRAKEKKWREHIAALPTKSALDDYRNRVNALQGAPDSPDRAETAQQIRELYAEIDREIETIQSLQQGFRGDLELLREQIAITAEMPARHTRELVDSIGLTSEQSARLGSRLLSGDMHGLMEQVLAPLSFSTSGAKAKVEGMPIYIHHATASGPLLPSAAGLSVDGELSNFTWPLDLASAPALIRLSGNSNQGGEFLVDASVDHRSMADDLITVAIDRMQLRDMPLEGTPHTAILLKQAMVSINGELRVAGEALSGDFTQSFSKALFDVNLNESAGTGDQVLAALLGNSSEFMMRIGFSGTVSSPELTFSSDLDRLFAATVEDAIAARVNEITADLQNQISNEIGPEIAAVRSQFSELEALLSDLQNSLDALSGLSR